MMKMEEETRKNEAATSAKEESFEEWNRKFDAEREADRQEHLKRMEEIDRRGEADHSLFLVVELSSYRFCCPTLLVNACFSATAHPI